MCQSAAELLSAIIGSVFTKTIVVTKPGISRFLLEEEGVNILAEMTAKFEVYIDMAKVHWEPLEDDVTYPSLVVNPDISQILSNTDCICAVHRTYWSWHGK